jgi:hypothetical protein
MTLRRLCAITALVLVPASASAQRAAPPSSPFVFAPDEKVSLLADGSYLLQHTDGGLIFEAQVAPDVRVVDNFASRTRRVLDPTRPRVFAYSVFGTFLLRVRMFNETSNPVRTPSYMPKATIQFAWMKNLSTEKPDRDEFNDGPIEMWLVNAIPFGHHSNGQNGCLFTDQARVNDECESVLPIPPTGRTANTVDGSFSTNYLRVGLNYRRLYPKGDDPKDVRRVTRREWGVGANLELNPSGYVGGSISDDLRPLYGATRVKTTTDVVVGNWKMPLLKVTCGRAWSSLSLDYINGAPPDVPNVTIATEAACLPARWGGSGLFVRYYRGQDYYNAAFLQSINRVQFGVTFLQGKFLAFPMPATDSGSR